MYRIGSKLHPRRSRLNGNTNGVHGNLCYGNRACYYVDDPAHPGQQMAGANPKPEFKIQVFNFSNCYSGICSPSSPRATWHIDGATGVSSTVTDLDSAAGGMKVDVTRTTSTGFSVTLTPLANPGAAFTTTGTFANASFPIDWFQFESFNGSQRARWTTKRTKFFEREESLLLNCYLFYFERIKSTMTCLRQAF